MEASVAGQAQGGDGAAQAGQEGAGQGPDLGQLASSLEALQGGQEEMRQFLLSQPWQAQQQAAEGEEGAGEPELDLSFLDPATAEFNPDQVAERLGGLISQVAEQRTQAAIGPVQEQLADMRRQSEARDLAAEIPEFADPQVAEQTLNVSRQIAEAYGKPELAGEPWFWRMTFMAARAAEMQQQEGGESPATAHLEGGGGAAPQTPEVDWAAEIIAPGGRKGRGALPFR